MLADGGAAQSIAYAFAHCVSFEPKRAWKNPFLLGERRARVDFLAEGGAERAAELGTGPVTPEPPAPAPATPVVPPAPVPTVPLAHRRPSDRRRLRAPGGRRPGATSTPRARLPGAASLAAGPRPRAGRAAAGRQRSGGHNENDPSRHHRQECRTAD